MFRILVLSAAASLALAATTSVQPRKLDVASLQRELRRQGVFLQDPAPARSAASPATVSG